MSPPIHKEADGTFVAMDHTPVATWHQVSAHDTASECETARQKDIASYKSIEPLKPGHRTKTKAFLSVVVYESRCVPAEQVYPAERPR